MTGSFRSGERLPPDRVIEPPVYELRVGFSMIRNVNEDNGGDFP
jgi:hypothetical protein